MIIKIIININNNNNNNNSNNNIIDFGNDNLLFTTNNGQLALFGPSVNSGFTITTGLWYAVAVTITTDGVVTFYVNGESVYSTTGVTINKTNNVWGIGSGTTTSQSEFWNGKISAIAIYYNKVLNTNEISSLFNP